MSTCLGSAFVYMTIVDCLGDWRAVAISEISFNRLKAGMKACGHLCSVWRSKTARVEKRAVAIWEMTFYRLKVEI